MRNKKVKRIKTDFFLNQNHAFIEKRENRYFLYTDRLRAKLGAVSPSGCCACTQEELKTAFNTGRL